MHSVPSHSASKPHDSDYSRNRARSIRFLILLAAILALAFFLSLRAGSYNTPAAELIRGIFGRASDAKINLVIRNNRLPRICTAMVAGAGLGLAGCILQAVLRNPLASASTLGVSQGATFGAAVAIIGLGLSQAGSWAIPLCSFLGSLLVAAVILGLSQFKQISSEGIVLAGVAISSMLTGATTLLQYFADEVALSSLVFWTFGDLGSTDWQSLRGMALAVLLLIGYCYLHRWDYNALLSGEETALSLGIHVRRLTLTNVVLTCFVCSVIVSQNGTVGVRNEVWIIPTVGCVNSIARAIEATARANKPEGVDEVVAFPHPYGCSQVTEDQENTRHVLADLINHPNAGAVLVLGLGCENSRIEVLKDYIGEVNPDRVKFLQVQDVENEQEAAEGIMKELMSYAATFKREKVSAKHLIVGMKCGGSDGLSGITANPTVGLFSDMLVSKGGTTILTEVPEMFGAETILMNRCANKELFEKTVHLINDFKEYFIKNGQEIYENPSPGNKDGGITTLEDKSLGCTQKSGSSLVKGVLAYGERVSDKGLNLLSAPGNDLVASTACAAAGAQMVLFTTGRGTPFASPVPTVKIATNSRLAGNKSNWIDFNAGRIVTDDLPLEDAAKELFQLVLDVASGKKVKAEIAGFHDLAIFKQGVTL